MVPIALRTIRHTESRNKQLVAHGEILGGGSKSSISGDGIIINTSSVLTTNIKYVQWWIKVCECLTAFRYWLEMFIVVIED